MGRPKIHLTPEAEAEADRISDRKYAQSEKGRAAIRRSNTSEKARERFRRYRQTDGYKAAQARYRATEKKRRTDAAYRERVRITEPERRRARLAVATLVRSGDIVKPSVCVGCGLPKPLDAHHHLGYAVEHWLSVQWLCRACHKALHTT